MVLDRVMALGRLTLLDRRSRSCGSRTPLSAAWDVRIFANTAGRALRELAETGIIYQVPGHGYFPVTGAGSDPYSVPGRVVRLTAEAA
jgi:hypothetical protein